MLARDGLPGDSNGTAVGLSVEECLQHVSRLLLAAITKFNA